jgi:hypothetical protein
MKAFILCFQIEWAGDRIICAGDYLDHGDLPEGLLSAKEENEYEEYATGMTRYGSLERYCDTPIPSITSSPEETMADIVHHVCGHLSFNDRQRIRSAIDIVFEAPEVLRNISKRQYVRRADLVEMRKTCPKSWDFDYVDLGHVVVSRICWSSDSSVSTHYDGGIHRGVWAGDRFDITSAAALEDKDENGEQVLWTDVTDNVLEEMCDIWSSDTGEGVLEFHSSRDNYDRAFFSQRILCDQKCPMSHLAKGELGGPCSDQYNE